MSKNEHWGEDVDQGYIRDVDSFFGHLDLPKEARKCFQYLKDTPPRKGTKVPKPRRTWLNWVEKAEQIRAEQNPVGPTDAAAPPLTLRQLASPVDNLAGLAEAQELWAKVQVALQDYFPTSAYNTWYKGLTALGFDDGRLVLLAPSAYVAQWIWDRTIRILEDVAECGVVFHVEAAA